MHKQERVLSCGTPMLNLTVKEPFFWPKLYFDQPDFVQLELSSTQCTQQEFLRKYTTHTKEKLIWDSAKVDDKKEYWQKYREKEEEIELDKDEKLSLIT